MRVVILNYFFLIVDDEKIFFYVLFIKHITLYTVEIHARHIHTYNNHTYYYIIILSYRQTFFCYIYLNFSLKKVNDSVPQGSALGLGSWVLGHSLSYFIFTIYLRFTNYRYQYRNTCRRYLIVILADDFV